MVRRIELTRGLFTILDEADFERLRMFLWSATEGRRGSFYASRKVKVIRDGRAYGRNVEMQREILDPERSLPRSLKVDHINGNTLDNRRSNLRIVDDSVSNINRRMFSNNTSGYRGVSYAKDVNKWRASIKKNGKTIVCGYYATAREAALAYNAKAKELHGDYAMLNTIPDHEDAKP
jgi:hypothetical protein